LAGRITGGNYPVPPIIGFFSNLLTAAQLLLLAFIVFGDNLWINILGIRQIPPWYFSAKQYGFQIGVAIFFILPQFINRYVVTGAFEVVVDGVVAYSKLRTGRMPTADDLVSIFTSYGLSIGR